MNAREQRQRQGAFTLIEVLAVVAITAVVAGAVALTFTYSVRAATERDVLERVTDLDAATRRLARVEGAPMRLLFDLERGEVRQQRADGTDTGQRVRLAPPMAITRVRTSAGDVRFGRAEINVSGAGHAPTYALLLGDGAAGGVLLAGLTGQATALEDDEAAQDILATIGATPPRHDAR